MAPTPDASCRSGARARHADPYCSPVEISVNGTLLWFDVEGAAVVPDGERMRERPTLVLIHGGPGGFDHYRCVHELD